MSLRTWLESLRDLLADRPRRKSRQAVSSGSVSRVCETLEEMVLLSSVGGLVFHDVNSNGRAESGERFVANMPVTLWDLGVDQLFGTTDDVLAQSTRTSQAGQYHFDLPVNTVYAVQFGTQFGVYRFSATNRDSATLSSTSISSEGISSNIIGGPAGHDTQIDAGLDTSVPSDVLNRRLQQA
ncbi:MAG: hypothetical protein KDA96_27595, partial [Planctomycetaceae bacterium]|nr:hypothetical protein [Planctomycetaceae bacterium]